MPLNFHSQYQRNKGQDKHFIYSSCYVRNIIRDLTPPRRSTFSCRNFFSALRKCLITATSNPKFFNIIKLCRRQQHSINMENKSNTRIVKTQLTLHNLKQRTNVSQPFKNHKTESTSSASSLESSKA